VDGRCCTTPKLCWRCCTTLAVPTCLYHFNQMGLIDRGLRLASDIVSQQVRQQEAASAAAVVQQAPAPPAAASIAPPSLPPQPAQVAQPPPATDLTALLTALSTQLSSLAAVVQAQSRELAEIKAAQSAAMLPALLPPPPAALLHGLPPVVQPALPVAQPLPPPVPAAAAVHRQRVLGASSPAALSNLFDALDVDSDDDDGKDPGRAEVSALPTQPATTVALTLASTIFPSLARHHSAPWRTERSSWPGCYLPSRRPPSSIRRWQSWQRRLMIGMQPHPKRTGRRANSKPFTSIDTLSLILSGDNPLWRTPSNTTPCLPRQFRPTTMTYLRPVVTSTQYPTFQSFPIQTPSRLRHPHPRMGRRVRKERRRLPPQHQLRKRKSSQQVLASTI
jgi:hypothetical protein